MSIAAGGDVRFLFIGKRKETSEPVDGYIEAVAEEAARQALDDQGIIPTKIKLDASPAPLAKNPASALPAKNNGSAIQLPARRNEERVTVIDRDKIRRNTAAIIDQALAMSFARGEGPMQIRARVAHAIHHLFKDFRNIASDQPVDRSAEMVEQISKLQEMIQRTESLLTQWSKFGPPRGGGGDGGGGGKNRHKPRKSRAKEEDAVLREIFQANLDLMKSIEAGLVGR